MIDDSLILQAEARWWYVLSGYDARWKPYQPYGYPAALDGMGTIAGPLLASLTIALIAVVLADQNAFPRANLTLGALVVAAAGFVAAVQFAFHARLWGVTPSQIEEWFPDHAEPSRRRDLREQQRGYSILFDRWARRARWAYDVGLLALMVGVLSLLIPTGHLSGERAIVVAIALLAVVAELGWIAATRILQPELPLVEVLPEPPDGSS